ncbi:flagellar basal body P-ring formation chaperone FlgA [Pseudoroseomonas globiformis]|uniref:Flagella basal body P-ring formation protein FlgA n=1 Tax=Teichococcus globiformis TaxID=2307229 RepID=A0ABV7G0F5_9PROT
MRPEAPLAAALLLLAFATPALARGEVREVWHAAIDLEPGDRLRPQDVVAAEPRYNRRGYADAAENIAGQEVRRRIRAEMPIMERDIGPPLAIRASQTVRVLWKHAGATLEMEGRAVENGSLGEEVRIHNPSSSRTIRARVVGDGTAEVGG